MTLAMRVAAAWLVALFAVGRVGAVDTNQAAPRVGPANGSLLIVGGGSMMSPGHEEGFVFLRLSAIDQHVNTRGRAEDLRPVLQKHRQLLGIALDEGTAILVQGDAGRVMGAGTVRFYATPDAPALELTAGARYDLAARREQTN